MKEKLTSCPVCKKSAFSDYLEVQDHFLSKENFIIQSCDGCGFRFVNPRPGADDIGGYYQSDAYISHGVKKQDLVSIIYRQVRIFSIRKKFRIIRSLQPSGNILDIGCGTGEFLAYCRSRNYAVQGIEPSEKAREFAVSVNGISVSEKLDATLFKPGTFNCITMWHVLEHVHELDLTIDTIKSLLAPGGIFIAAVPNSNSWDASRYKNYWAAYDVPRHLYHFTSETMQTLAKRKGFAILKTIPQKLDAYYVTMLSEKYRTGRTNYINMMIYGFWSNFRAKTGGKGHSSLIFILSPEKAQF